MKITLDTHRDTKRLARALAKASWHGDIPWDKQRSHDRQGWMRQARRVLDALKLMVVEG